jgi:hypothetical protein
VTARLLSARIEHTSLRHLPRTVEVARSVGFLDIGSRRRNTLHAAFRNVACDRLKAVDPLSEVSSDINIWRMSSNWSSTSDDDRWLASSGSVITATSESFSIP